MAGDTIRRWALALCSFPFLTTIVFAGFPTDLRAWEYLTIAPVFFLVIGSPQIAMYLVTRAAKLPSLRIIALGLSVMMALAYAVLGSQIDLASNSTASLSLLIIQFYLGCGAVTIIGVVALLVSVLSKMD